MRLFSLHFDQMDKYKQNLQIETRKTHISLHYVTYKLTSLKRKNSPTLLLFYSQVGNLCRGFFLSLG